MDKEKEVVVETTEETAPAAEVKNFVGYKQVCKNLVADRLASRVSDVKIVNMQYREREEDGYKYFVITIDKAIDGYRLNPETEDFELTKVNVFSISLFSVLNALRNNEATANFAAKVEKMPQNSSFLFNGGKMTILVQPIAANTEYVSPFTAVAEPVEIDHDTIFYFIEEMSYGPDGQKIVGATIDNIAAAFAAI